MAKLVVALQSADVGFTPLPFIYWQPVGGIRTCTRGRILQDVIAWMFDVRPWLRSLMAMLVSRNARKLENNAGVCVRGVLGLRRPRIVSKSMWLPLCLWSLGEVGRGYA
jgi:hypothetical protein